MTEVDDATLTKFLIRCFSGIFDGVIKPVPKSTIPGAHQRYSKDGGLVYLETTAGSLSRYRVDVSILQEETNEHIWYMSIMADINEGLLSRIHLPPMELRIFLMNARQVGFLETLEEINKGDPKFSLFHIEDHEEPAAVGSKGIAGTLLYEETIQNKLDLFRGEETIRFTSQNKSIREYIYRASFQGGRI